ncbi:hypothetical protein Q5692_26385, partial [Microcoleus sp. C2C3]|uniref:hypothetical protein n=1 Tax=unclassified Microcoleus TaxID=2642155 RepID=UPI002FCE81D9
CLTVSFLYNILPAFCQALLLDWRSSPDFQENPNAEPDELWEPEGASYYNGELILQRPAAVDTPCNS